MASQEQDKNSSLLGAESPQTQTAPVKPDQPKPADWRQSRWLICVELLVVALIFVADARHLIPFSKTPFLFAFGWLSMRLRRVTWRSIGFKLYGSWRKTLAVGIAAGVLMEAFELFVSQPLLVRILHKPPDFSDFREVKGNIVLTLIFLALSWTLAAFGEEMVFRGYLMNRVADLFKRTRTAWIISLIAVHVGFGLAHSYQDLTGVIDEGLMGLLLGIIYLRTDRNLSVPIIAHGVQDSIDFILIFLGMYPYM
ncbi:MAG: CPBP family intramembrane glutamic endopeptidase [Terracidiphilus sp.]